VVTEDKVLVTTSYNATSAGFPKLHAICTVIGLAALVLLLSVPVVLRGCAAGGPFFQVRLLGMVAFCVLLGLLVHSLFLGYGLLSANRVGHVFDQYRWLQATMVVVIGLMLAAYVFEGKWARIIVAVAALGFGALVVLARPDQAYYNLFAVTKDVAGEGGVVQRQVVREPSYHASGMLGMLVVPFAVGLVVLIGTLVRWRKKPVQDAAPAGPKASWVAFCVRLVVFGAAFGIGLVAFSPNPLAFVGKAKLHLLKLDLGQVSSFARPNQLFRAVGFAFAAWALADLLCLKTRPHRTSRWLAATALVLGGTAFVETNYLKATESFVRAVVCLDRASGDTLWVREVFPGPLVKTSSLNSQASPTPVVQDGRVYAYFGSPGLVCLDLDGNVVWTNTELPFERCIHGPAASPVASDGRIVVSSGQPKAPYVAAVDAKTGQCVWRAERPPFRVHGEHRTPTITTVNGRAVVLVLGWTGLWVYDAASGEEIRYLPLEQGTPGEMVASIVVDGNRLYLPHRLAVRALDAAKLLAGADPLLWAVEMDRKGPNASSPVLCRGKLFSVSDNGYVACQDATSGAVLYRERVSRAMTMPALIAVGDRVYVSDARGKTYVLAAEDTFRMVATNDLDEAIYASAAPVDGRLFVRTAKHVWCIEEGQ
jgi:outer membrane protein assembly factor BamB